MLVTFKKPKNPRKKSKISKNFKIHKKKKNKRKKIYIYEKPPTLENIKNLKKKKPKI